MKILKPKKTKNFSIDDNNSINDNSKKEKKK